MNPSPKRLPPYGRALLAKRRQGLAPVAGVWIVTDFKRACGFSGWRVVVPDGLDPLSLDFTFVAGLEVHIGADTWSRLEQLAQAVAAYRPRRLVGACREPPSLHRFITPAA